MHRAFAAIVLLAAVAVAQDGNTKPTQEQLLAAELASPFLQKAPWRTDWDDALAAAKAQKQMLFGYFTTVNH
ncbi:MAG: hypothetical protein IT456_20465 [Planctomycetes bacterium]|nr:hypothetical protein [Planctomycetota bacterium]